MRPVRRGAGRVVRAGVLLAMVGLGGVLVALRLDDPVPRFAARRGQLASVTRDSATIEEGHRLEAVTITSTSGMQVPMLVKRPLLERPAPLVVILGGHATGREAARLIPDTRGRVVVALSYPYTGPHRMKGVEVLKWAPDIRQALHDTPPAIQLALDWLLQQPWVDRQEVHGVGASLGTPFMTVAAALDARITHVWSVHGAGRSRDLLGHNARESVPALFAPLVGTLADVIAGGPYLTPERWVGRIAPRPFTMINATEDERLPRAAVEALHAAARAPKQLLWLPGRHVQRNRPEVVRALVTTVLEKMERGVHAGD